MEKEFNIWDMARQIDAIKKSTLKLQKLCGGAQALDRNAARILACVKMLV